MNVLPLQVFVSLMLVVGGVLALLYSVRQADHEHADRLSLLPFEDDRPAGAGAKAGADKVSNSPTEVR